MVQGGKLILLGIILFVIGIILLIGTATIGSSDFPSTDDHILSSGFLIILTGLISALAGLISAIAGLVKVIKSKG
jgi:hypothetical protein